MITGPNGQTFAVPPDPATLRAIAERSGGEAYEADDADQLDSIYEELGSRIGTTLEQREVGSLFAAGGFALLLGGLVSGLRHRGSLL